IWVHTIRAAQAQKMISRTAISITLWSAWDGDRALMLERAIERERLKGDLIPGVTSIGGRPGPHAHFGQGGRVAEQLAQSPPQRAGVAGGHNTSGSRTRDLREATDVAEQERLAECECREQDPGLIGLQVGQHYQVGSLEVGGQLVIADEARLEAHIGGCAGLE